MVLTKGDDYPIHQTADPIAYAGTDRNFYDRYFFNGYAPGVGDDGFLAVAMGVYPHLNVIDASFCWLLDGRQVNLHASRGLGMERMDMRVGPIAIEVVEPLRVLRITVDAPEQQIRAEITFTGRAFPLEEPRFTRRNGPRVLMDVTRMTQNGRYEGWVEVDGTRTDVSGWIGTRDRSWGVRPIGAPDAQPASPPIAPQFFWLWNPCVMEGGDLYCHTNDDAHGRFWNRRATWRPEGGSIADERHYDEAAYRIDWRKGTRHAERAGDHRAAVVGCIALLHADRQRQLARGGTLGVEDAAVAGLCDEPPARLRHVDGRDDATGGDHLAVEGRTLPGALDDGDLGQDG